MKLNPVLFDQSKAADNMVILRPTLPEYAWKSQITGYDSEGVYVVDQKIARSGYYDFTTRRVPWAQIQMLELKHHISIVRILSGLLLFAVGIMVFKAGWIDHTHTGVGILTIPVIGVVSGTVILLGARAVRLKIRDAQGGRYTWLASAFHQHRRRVGIDLSALLNRCGHCGHDPINLLNGVCPKCGAAIDDVRRRRPK